MSSFVCCNSRFQSKITIGIIEPQFIGILLTYWIDIFSNYTIAWTIIKKSFFYEYYIENVQTNN